MIIYAWVCWMKNLCMNYMYIRKVIIEDLDIWDYKLNWDLCNKNEGSHELIILSNKNEGWHELLITLKNN